MLNEEMKSQARVSLTELVVCEVFKPGIFGAIADNGAKPEDQAIQMARFVNTFLNELEILK